MTETPSTRLGSLLTAFGVGSVLAVDDLDRDETLDSELMAGRIERGETPYEDVLGVPGIHPQVEARGVPTADEETVRDIAAELLRSGEISFGPPEGAEGTASAFEALKLILDEAGVPFEVIHFDAWHGPDQVGPSTLLLFDFRHGQEAAGARLAVEYASHHGAEARVAVLSQELGDEQTLWSDHLAGADSDLGKRIAWIAKASLTAAPDAIVERMAVALSAPLLVDLRAGGLDSLRTALEDTERATAGLSPYELHHLTIGSAVNDGGFEPESLVTRFARRSLPIAMAGMQLETLVHSSIRSLREVQEAKIISGDTTSTLVDLQRDDYYIHRSQLAGRHQGVVAGDIFALVSTDLLDVPPAGPEQEEQGVSLEVALSDLSKLSLCILVAQPCDLAVRSDGTRVVSSRSLEALTLDVAPAGDKDALNVGLGVPQKQHIFRLPWLAGSATGSHRRAIYKKPISIPMLAVDACVWSPLDAAVFPLGGTATERVSVNWQRRYVQSLAEAVRIEEACVVAAGLGAEQQTIGERIKLEAAASDGSVEFRYDDANRSLAWGLVRVARLRSPYVESLLTTYNDFRRRDAFPASLA